MNLNYTQKSLKQFQETYRGFYLEDYLHIFTPRQLDIFKSRISGDVTQKQIAQKWGVPLRRIKQYEELCINKIYKHRENIKLSAVEILRQLVNS